VAGLPGAPSLPQSAPSVAIPTLVSDPIASLRCWPVEVELAGTVVQIPALSAADWLAVLMSSPLDLEAVFPGLAPGALEIVDDLLYSGEMTVLELQDLALDVISMASGRPWWIAMRLIVSATSNWGLLGSDLALGGVDASKLSLGAWLDALFILIVRATPEDQLTMFFSKLEFPPPGYEPQEPVMALDDFMAAMADG
jgi:hypothetical protein